MLCFRFSFSPCGLVQTRSETILDTFWLNLGGSWFPFWMLGGSPEHKKQPRGPKRSTRSEQVEFQRKHSSILDCMFVLVGDVSTHFLMSILLTHFALTLMPKCINMQGFWRCPMCLNISNNAHILVLVFLYKMASKTLSETLLGWFGLHFEIILEACW